MVTRRKIYKHLGIVMTGKYLKIYSAVHIFLFFVSIFFSFSLFGETNEQDIFQHELQLLT